LETIMNAFKSLVAILSLCAATGAHAELFVVNSVADPGNGICDAAECTLREALAGANAAQEFSSTIDFAIPGGGVKTIRPLAVLPAIVREVTIRGFTQPGAVAPIQNPFVFTLMVELDGSLIPDTGPVVGLHSNVPGNFANVEITGLSLINFSRPQGDGVAMRVQTAVNFSFQSNHVGLNAAGTLAAGNDIGVLVESQRNSSISSNVISGNIVGVMSGGSLSEIGIGLSIAGNRIGTNRAATTALPNGSDGIRIVARCGQPAADFDITGNVISGNGRDGIHLTGETPTCNLLAGRFPSEIVGNRIGVSINGTALGNGRHGVGVGLLTTTASLQIGTRSSSQFPEDRNIIGFNSGAGVAVFDGAGGVLVRQNTYNSNTGLPIDLGADGPTANDAGDADTGPNRRMNFPTLGTLRDVAGGVQFGYSLDSTIGNATYPVRVDFYASANGVLVFLDSDFYEAPGTLRTFTLNNLGSAQLVAMTNDGTQSEFDGTASHSSEFSGPAQRSLFSSGFE
jgi:CSLREA domain-containing protein